MIRIFPRVVPHGVIVRLLGWVEDRVDRTFFFGALELSGGLCRV